MITEAPVMKPEMTAADRKLVIQLRQPAGGSQVRDGMRLAGRLRKGLLGRRLLSNHT